VLARVISRRALLSTIPPKTSAPEEQHKPPMLCDYLTVQPALVCGGLAVDDTRLQSARPLVKPLYHASNNMTGSRRP